MALRPRNLRNQRNLGLATTKRLVFGAALLGMCGSYGLREDEVKCEQAVYYLEQCCPELQSHPFHCLYRSSCESSTRPDLTVANADCILGRSCEQMQSAGFCDPDTWHAPLAPVCP